MTEPETVQAPATTPPPPVATTAETTGGRKRSPAEIKQGKKAAAFQREVKGDAALLRKLIGAAVPDGGANTQQVCAALGKLVRREHGLTLGAGALRHLIDIASDARVVHHRKHGNAIRWFVSAGPVKKKAAVKSASAAKKTAARCLSTKATPVKTPRAEMVEAAEPAVLPELDVMAATNALLASLNAAEQHRVLVWLADRFPTVATTVATKTATATTRVAVVKKASAKPVRAAPASPATKAAAKRSTPAANPVKFGAAISTKSVGSPVTSTSKDSLAELSRVLRTKKPGSGTELFLVLVDHLADDIDGGPTTRDVAALVRAARLKMSNPSYSGFAARDQGLAKQAGGRWTLTPAGEKRLKGMGKK